jgi:DNA-binding transcriptional regulator YiaG
MTRIPRSQTEFAAELGAEFIAGLETVLATLQREGVESVKSKYGSHRPSSSIIELPSTTAADVAAARQALGVSQTIFAQILGASVQAVRAWEQGAKAPSGMARRLIGEIRHDPAYWRKRFSLPAVSKSKPAGRTRTGAAK